ncbi:LAMI_0A02410g1_1 [Lachancea mirantina]|uniref:LAMI_0A02410g1_1 n=1 Tax=Lachancea mirantina TaxID=1230905 RepID=A0A1G4IMI6_9SACH|nr:LAMI_0A02410g1_1 [Lachancea mirantina]
MPELISKALKISQLDIKIEFKPPANGDFFTSNELITGRVVVSLPRSTAVQSVTVTLRGLCRTLNPGREKHMSGMDATNINIQYVNTFTCHFPILESKTLFPPQNVTDAISAAPKKGYTLAGGEHSFDFAFLIPAQARPFQKGLNDDRPSDKDEDMTPPSFNSYYGKDAKDPKGSLPDYNKNSEISYYLKAELILGKTLLRTFTPSPSRLEIYEPFGYIPDVDSKLNEIFSGGCVVESDRKFKLKGNATLSMELRPTSWGLLCREDRLFTSESGKFDKLYLRVSGNLKESLQVKLKHIRLVLIEVTSYALKGLTTSSLKRALLLQEDLNLAKLAKKISAGSQEAVLDLSDVPKLSDFRFNHDDIQIRGNRIYSFESCGVDRKFQFEMTLALEINGQPWETKIKTFHTDVHCQAANKTGQLPTYESSSKPPEYAAEHS